MQQPHTTDDETRPALAVRWLADHLGTGDVVDFGAGLGRHALYLAERGLSVTALDVSPTAVAAIRDTARRRSVDGIEARVADARAPLDRDIDGAVCTFLLHYFTEVQARRFIDEIQRRTRPGGIHVHIAFTRGSRPVSLPEMPDAFVPDPAWLDAAYAGWDTLHRSSWRTAVSPHRGGGADADASTLMVRRRHAGSD